jgi:NADH-quinone oxidoreductase subunit E/NADP-reducing hydrogenase subunit HndA
MAYRGFSSKVVVDYDVPLDKEECKDCGICMDYCPTSALTLPDGTKPRREPEAGKGKSPGRPISRNPEREKLLGSLIEAQRREGLVSDEAMSAMAVALDIPLSEVYGVATFYSFLSVKPQGRNVIRICKSIPCHMENASMVVDAIGKELGIGPGETTPDRRFTLELANCIGACDQAPAMLVNDQLHGHLTPEKVPGILRSYK